MERDEMARPETDTQVRCGRCGKLLLREHEREYCWLCTGALCGECWEDHGHCGHPAAEEANRKAREAGSWEERHAAMTEALKINRFIDLAISGRSEESMWHVLVIFKDGTTRAGNASDVRCATEIALDKEGCIGDGAQIIGVVWKGEVEETRYLKDDVQGVLVQHERDARELAEEATGSHRG